MESTKEEIRSVEKKPYFIGKVWAMGKRSVIGFPKGIKELIPGTTVFVYKAPTKVEIYNQDLSTPFCTLEGSDFINHHCKIKETCLAAGKNPDIKCRLCLLKQL